MSNIVCTRRIEFDAAHRVYRHEGKCKHLHGHRYALEASFAAKVTGGAKRRLGPLRAAACAAPGSEAPEREFMLDTLGRVIDFAVIKEKLGNWIDDNWDHSTILFDKDKALGKAISDITGQKIFYLPQNPTVENMADYILNTVCPTLFKTTGVKCTRVRLYETPNCWAEIICHPALVAGSGQ